MKWPWRMKHVQLQKQLLEEVRQERGTLAATAINVEQATSDIRKAFGLDDLSRRVIAELHNRGSTQ